MDADQTLPFEIVKFSRGLNEGDVALATLGFESLALHSWTDGKIIHMELFMLAPRSAARLLAPALEQIAVGRFNSSHALLRGEVIGPYGPIIPEATVSAFMVSAPAYWNDHMDSFVSPNGYDVVVAWLIPITSSEARFIETYGSEKFEVLLADQQPDLTNYNRPDLVLS